MFQNELNDPPLAHWIENTASSLSRVKRCLGSTKLLNSKLICQLIRQSKLPRLSNSSRWKHVTTEFLASAGVFCASYSQLALFLRLQNGVIWRGPNLGKTPSAPSPRTRVKTALIKCSWLFPSFHDTSISMCISYLKTPENPLENSLVSKNHQKPVVYKWRQGRKTFAVEAGSPGSPWVWVVFHAFGLENQTLEYYHCSFLIFVSHSIFQTYPKHQVINLSMYSTYQNTNMSTYLPILICSPHPLYQTKSVFYYYPSMYASIYALSLSIYLSLFVYWSF